jgi:hypothetical protein
MAKMTMADIVTESFLDGITAAALFGKLRRPGAPTVFAGEIPDLEMNLHVQAAKKVLAGNSGIAFRGRKSEDGKSAGFSHPKS